VKEYGSAHRREDTMLLRWLLFETKMGEMLLVFLERRAGLSVVQADWLAVQPSGKPTAVSKPQ
jgi:hypothetical protein